MKSKNKKLTQIERIFGSFIYQNHFPFKDRLNAFSISHDHLSNYLDFVSKSSHDIWTLRKWDCNSGSIKDFHLFLYHTVNGIVSNQKIRLNLCIILSNIEMLQIDEQIEYLIFQKKNIRTGFKTSVVLNKPKVILDGLPIGFRNLLFVFVISNNHNITEEILKLKV
ncbi:MAG: hypothetical protein JXI43_12450 [Tissierellales bacterium]|nr:hypothetical protein [Tissierellales bacterium]